MIKKLAIAFLSVLILSCSSSSEEQRQKIPDGTYRPSGFHAFINHGQGNYPVSLVKADTLYHLFYTTGTDEWGHLSSTNLLSWTPEISFPTKTEGIGEVIWDTRNFSGLNAEWYSFQNLDGAIHMSYSVNGLQWDEYTNNPVIQSEGIPTIIWNDDLEIWILTLSSGNNISIHTSTNLIEWQEKSSIAAAIDISRAALMKQNEQWVLLMQGESLYYQLGDFDGETFSSDRAIVNYEGVVASKGAILKTNDEAVFLAKNISDHEQLPTFTTPRSITLDDEVLKLFPAESFSNEIVGKRRAKLNRLFTDGPSWYSFYANRAFNKMEIVITDNSSELRITWNKSENNINVNGSALASENVSEILLASDYSQETITVDILIDHASVDLFLNKGAFATTILTFPDTFFSKVEVFLDDEMYDANGVLYDIGI
ncbi:GH32 C-terminal domain-containing protein [Ekhidna sp.]